jgi:hypothetical protein
MATKTFTVHTPPKTRDALENMEENVREERYMTLDSEVDAEIVAWIPGTWSF